MNTTMISAALAVVLTAMPILPGWAQPEWTVMCLCQSGDDPKRYRSQIEITDAIRASAHSRINAGELNLGAIVKLTATGCSDKASMGAKLCGETTVSKPRPDGTREVTKVENKVIVGSRTIKITSTSSIPGKTGQKPGVIVIDDERWPKTRSIFVNGQEQ